MSAGDILTSFPDEEFNEACKQLDEENTEGYDFFVESHDVRIFRQYNEVSGLYQYKIYGFLRGVSCDICADVYRDLEYRKSWDSYVNELSLVLQEEDRELVYWHVNFPWPMSNRDYLYQRQLKQMTAANGDKVYVVLAKSKAECALVPEKTGVIRVLDYIQSCALTSDGCGGAKAFMHYYDNPRGSIPTMLINWGAKTGVPSFLTSMQDACRKYNKYLSNKEGSTTS